MNSTTKIVRFFSSYEFFACLLACTVLWSTLCMHFFKLGFWETANLVPVKIFFGLLLLNRLAGFFVEIRGKKKTALLTTGVLAVLVGCSLSYVYRFEGIRTIGEGESLLAYEEVEKGPLGKAWQTDIKFIKLHGNPLKHDMLPKAEFQIGKGDERLVLEPGQHKWWYSGLEVELLSIEPSLRVMLRDMGGKELFSSFIALGFKDLEAQQYFLVPPVPHRFYISITDDERKPLSIRASRGKLVSSVANVALGEDMEFDGLKVSFPEVKGWAFLKVRVYPGEIVVYAGVVMIALGMLVVFQPVVKRLWSIK